MACFRIIVLGLMSAFAGALPRVADAMSVSLVGAPEVVYDSARNGCGRNDTPDINARAFRGADGAVTVFALHFVNRALRGPDLDHLTIDCHVVLASPLDPDPAHYADRNFVTATWTLDGRTVSALVHHEYHADDHGRCSVTSSLGCWYNTILAYQSHDGGVNFEKSSPLVVAAAPFRQDVDQGRHRGFFNPSNIFSDGSFVYFFGSTTGWTGQPFGACLFRSRTPFDSAAWRAFDGTAFTIHYADPYGAPAPAPRPCRPIAPFGFPVGAVVRQRDNGHWLAVFQAAKNDTVFPVDGFYYATAADLLHWSLPKLLRAGPTLYDDLCTAGPTVMGYPSLLDPRAKGRNFDDVGRDAYLYFAMIEVDHCATGPRQLVRQRIAIDLSRESAR